MLEPVIKELTADSFNGHHDRFSVSFLHLSNDKNSAIDHAQNDAIYHETASRYRPELKFYSTSYSNLNRLFSQKTKFLKQSLKLEPKQIAAEFGANGPSKIYAITPSIANKQLTANHFERDRIQHFIDSHRYAPITELQLGNFRDLVERCDYFGIIFVEGRSSKMDKKALQLIDAAEQMMIDNELWNIQSMKRYKEWEREQGDEVEIDKMDRIDRPGMYQLIMSWCNATEYEGWAAHTFGIDESAFPMMVMYNPKLDGYWKMTETESGQTMTQFVEDVFVDKLEITFARSWFARQAAKLERWLNSLKGWQVALVFVGVFVGLCGLMVFLDWVCSPKADDYADAVKID